MASHGRQASVVPLGVGATLSKRKHRIFTAWGEEETFLPAKNCSFQGLRGTWVSACPELGTTSNPGDFHRLSGAGRYLCRTGQEIRLLNYSLSPRGPVILFPLPTDVLSKRAIVTIYLCQT